MQSKHTGATHAPLPLHTKGLSLDLTNNNYNIAQLPATANVYVVFQCVYLCTVNHTAKQRDRILSN